MGGRPGTPWHTDPFRGYEYILLVKVRQRKSGSRFCINRDASRDDSLRKPFYQWVNSEEVLPQWIWREPSDVKLTLFRYDQAHARELVSGWPLQPGDRVKSLGS